MTDLSAKLDARPATFTCDKSKVGPLYYFAVADRAPGPYKTQRHVEAILDIASDGTLAGVELIDSMPPPPLAQPSAVSVADNAAMELFVDAMAEADKAMRKFPQPNYVISKVAEEAGEVVKAAIHCAEGRDTPEHVAEEIRQTMAMLIRLYLEGDQVHGLPPVYSSLKAEQEWK